VIAPAFKIHNENIRIEALNPLMWGVHPSIRTVTVMGGEVWSLQVSLRELLTAEGAKDENRLKLLHTIMARPGPQAYLAHRSGQSQGAVSDAVKELAAKGWVTSDKDGRKRPAAITETTGAAVGIELGFRYSAVVARRVEQSYDQARVQLRPVGAAHGTARWVGDVADAVQEAVASLGEEEIAAIGLGIPRIINPRYGTLVPPALPPWDAADHPAQLLADELWARNSGPRLIAPKVVLDNDANLAAYAHSIYEFPNTVTLIGIKASTGIGAGIVTDGKIFRGARGAAGEIGHVVVRPSGDFCSCGGRGCLETLVGADALVAQARTVLGHRQLPSPKTLEELVQMARDGSVACQRVLAEAAATLGFAIGNLCNVLNPNVVVLSGAFGRRGATKFTMEPCVASIRQSAMRAATDPDESDEDNKEGVTVAATTMEHPAAHGALVVALEGTRYEPASSSTARTARNRSR
jgi:predicted NBD/HSP70 family sugar kinase